MTPTAPIPRSQHRQICTYPPRAKGSLDRRSKRLSFSHFFLRRKKCGRRRPPPRQGKIDSPRSDASALFVSDGDSFAPRRERFFVSDGDNFAPRRELLLSAVTKVAKSTGRNYVSALSQRAMPVRFRPRFPSRNRRFPDRCRSPDCASTAFRCRCLLLRQKLFVLPCRRLRNNYILCPTGTPTFAAARRQRRDLIIANPVEANTPTVAGASGRGSLRAGERRHSPFDRQ